MPIHTKGHVHVNFHMMTLSLIFRYSIFFFPILKCVILSTRICTFFTTTTYEINKLVHHKQHDEGPVHSCYLDIYYNSIAIVLTCLLTRYLQLRLHSVSYRNEK